MITIRSERPADVAAREALLDVAYGPVRFEKPSQRLRAGRAPALALVAVATGHVVGTVRLWPVLAGAGRPALLLGPLAVHPDCRRRGIGAALMRRAIHAAKEAGHRAVLLIGDAPYYARFGFSAEKTGALVMPGADRPDRLLGLELSAGALDGADGVIRAGTRRRSTARAAKAIAVAQAA
ncbi:MAG TPA: N-acetyltransferase [Xanthobacteraceae bacterium]|nr:N-acetyltransferase [Xanthobacteraceae bacterium]